MGYEEDFRCPYCKSESQIIKGYHNDYSTEFYIMTHCRKHGFILFEKRTEGFLRQVTMWESRRAGTKDFDCRNCVHWGVNKYSEEDDDNLGKACALNIPLKDNPSYEPDNNFRRSYTIACEEFKHKEVEVIENGRK